MPEAGPAPTVHRETRRNARTAVAERPQNRENALNQVQKTEVQTVSNASIFKKAREIEERNIDEASLTNAESATLEWKRIAALQEGEGRDFPAPLILLDGTEIIGVMQRNGNELICARKDENVEGGVAKLTISRQELLNIQLLDDEENILSLIPDGPEKVALELHIRSIKPADENDPPLPSANEINGIIKEAAEKNGIMTTAKVKELVNWRRDAIKDNHDIETQTQLDWLKGIEVAMVGKTILDQKAMKAILLSPDLDKEIDRLSENIERYQSALEKEHFEKGSKEHKKLQEDRDNKKALEDGKKKLQDPEFKLEGSTIESVLSGRADAETTALFGKNIEKSIAKADPTDLLEQLAPVDDTWAEVLKGVEDEERRKSILLLLAIFGTFAFNSGKDLLPQVASEGR